MTFDNKETTKASLVMSAMSALLHSGVSTLPPLTSREFRTMIEAAKVLLSHPVDDVAFAAGMLLFVIGSKTGGNNCGKDGATPCRCNVICAYGGRRDILESLFTRFGIANDAISLIGRTGTNAQFAGITLLSSMTTQLKEAAEFAAKSGVVETLLTMLKHNCSKQLAYFITSGLRHLWKWPASIVPRQEALAFSAVPWILSALNGSRLLGTIFSCSFILRVIVTANPVVFRQLGFMPQLFFSLRRCVGILTHQPGNVTDANLEEAVIPQVLYNILSTMVKVAYIIGTPPELPASIPSALTSQTFLSDLFQAFVFTQKHGVTYAPMGVALSHCITRFSTLVESHRLHATVYSRFFSILAPNMDAFLTASKWRPVPTLDFEAISNGRNALIAAFFTLCVFVRFPIPEATAVLNSDFAAEMVRVAIQIIADASVAGNADPCSKPMAVSLCIFSLTVTKQTLLFLKDALVANPALVLVAKAAFETTPRALEGVQFLANEQLSPTFAPIMWGAFSLFATPAQLLALNSFKTIAVFPPSNSPDDVCTVCMVESGRTRASNKPFVRTPCFCVVHKHCLEQWIKEPGHIRCPVCNADLYKGISDCVTFASIVKNE